MVEKKRSAVFLDRDGVVNLAPVVNGLPKSPMSLDEFFLEDQLLPSVLKLRQNNYEIVVITNQPEIARGKLSMSTLLVMHEKIRKVCGIELFYICPHDDGMCACRKPLPGLIIQAQADLSLDLESSFLIGDRWKDIEAANSAGCQSVWIDRSYTEKAPSNFDFMAKSLIDATTYVLQCTGKRHKLSM